MICKPIVIKTKRSRSSFGNSFYGNKTQSKPSKTDLNQTGWENSLVSLNKVLHNLNDDTIKRYNTEVDRYADLKIPTPVNEETKTLKSSFTKNNIQARTSNKFQTLEPEPWFNDNEIRKAQRSSKTNNVMNSSHFSLPKEWEHRNSMQRSIRDSSYRDQLNTDPEMDKSQRIQKITKLLEQNQALWTENFTYTNEQKAKVSIQYLLHEQKHKKMQKILKYKRNLIDKPGLQKNKINQHSKYLVNMLKKLSKDHLFASSLIQDKEQSKRRKLLKTKTNPRKASGQKIEQKTQYETIDQAQKQDSKSEMKSASCCNLESSNEAQTKVIKKRTKPTCSIKQIGADFKQQNQNKQIHNYRMTFKPRKNFIFEKRTSSYSERNLKPNEFESMRKLSDKHFAVTNHFLKIKKVKS